MECKKRISKDTCVAVDIKKKRILSLQVTSEQVHDSQVLPELIEDITIKQNKEIDMTIADGAYDNNKNFQFLSFRGIKPAIKVRKNSRCRERPITTREIRRWKCRKTIYRIGKIAYAMVRDGL